jgi:hypothetical protein
VMVKVQDSATEPYHLVRVASRVEYPTTYGSSVDKDLEV